MRRLRFAAATVAAAALVASAMLACPVAGASAAVVRGPSAQLPQVVPAIRGGQWLAGQLVPQGYVPTAAGPGHPDYSSTAQTILALSAANVDLAGAAKAVGFMAAHVDQYVRSGGSDGPGQLALLILDAVSLGADPTDFGGTDLVSRLLATQQQSGADAGLFGTESQVTDYDAGGYQQGLALTALAAAGVRGTAAVHAAVGWLDGEECPDGGWTSPDNAVNPCNGSPADYSGPDTNSTALAADGLGAEGAAGAGVTSRILDFYRSGQDSDGGWSFYPNTPSVAGATDPDSTALVIQALVALHSPAGAAIWQKPSGNPVSALLTFQLHSGSGNGAFYFPPAPSPPSIISTYQAIPALAGLTFPFGPAGHGFWTVGATGSVAAYGGAPFHGSASGEPLRAPVAGLAPTPDGGGYWLVAADGGVFSYGDAHFHGSAGAMHLDAPIVGIAPTPDGGGYWFAARDGGVFSYGDAHFHGSVPGTGIAAEVTALTTTPDGAGYWLATAAGSVVPFGDAGTYHLTGGVSPVGRITGIATGRV